jgi:hypothetical protein
MRQTASMTRWVSGGTTPSDQSTLGGRRKDALAGYFM